MKKSIAMLTTIGAVLFSSAFLHTTVEANPLQDIQNERAEIQADLSAAEEKIADVMIELEELNKKIEQVNNALTANEEKMKDTKSKIESTREEIAVIEGEISELEEDIERRFEILKQRMVSFQQSGGDISFLEVLFGAENFGDLISRVSAITKIAESDEQLMKEQEEDKTALEEKQGSVEQKLADLTAMKDELEAMQATILTQKEQNEADKKELKEKQEHLVALKTELENKDSSLAAVAAEIQRRAAARESSNSIVATSTTSGGGELTTLSKKEDKAPVKSVSKAPSGSISTVLNAGMPYLNSLPYVWGGGSPRTGFDCSGFVSWAFAQAGINIPSSTSALQSVGTKVSYSNIRPGDLVFFNTYKTNGHVGIYLGNGKFIGSQSSTGVAIAGMTSGYWDDHFAGHVRRVY
ncbi:NlpC/P60 family protein [Virgibacillus kekensis]|uniref:NlpC/P60 family protein n=1 Tax=Virgibacillus kekensis TaxID=202261 RepID=A0ABV9DJX7_9BACI